MQTQLAQVQQQMVTQGQELESAGNWSMGLKIAFRFTCSYLCLFCLPFPLGTLPYSGKLEAWYDKFWLALVPWVGRHVLSLAQPITPLSNGTGDTVYGYTKMLCFLVFAMLATLGWSGLDRKRGDYRALHEWTRFYLRIFLGLTLLTYGAYKVVPAQFPPNWQWRYLENYGDSSPMGLLWTFMSASRSYTIFAGSVEMLGGILLFIPRLVTLGTLISMAAMTNVFLLNMSYDVPVKLFSFHLLLLSAFVAAPEVPALASFFVFNRASRLGPAGPHFQRVWLRQAFAVGQIALGIFIAGYMLHGSNSQLENYLHGDFAAKAPLRGAWTVDEFMLDGHPLPALLTDSTRWQKAIFDTGNGITVQGMDGKLLRFSARIDPNNKTYGAGETPR